MTQPTAEFGCCSSYVLDLPSQTCCKLYPRVFTTGNLGRRARPPASSRVRISDLIWDILWHGIFMFGSPRAAVFHLPASGMTYEARKAKDITGCAAGGDNPRKLPRLQLLRRLAYLVLTSMVEQASATDLFGPICGSHFLATLEFKWNRINESTRTSLCDG